GSMSMTFTSSSSPSLTTSRGFSTRSSRSSLTCTRPSMPGSISTKAPKSATLVTLPFTRLPIGYLLGSSVHGSGCSCLMPRLNRSFSTSMLSTTASTSSPFLNKSPGCLMRWVQEMSETCTRPSMPSCTPTKMPKSVTLRTWPRMTDPIGYCSSSSVQGFGSICFMPRLMRFALPSTSSTTAATWSPIDIPLDGCFTHIVQLIELLWSYIEQHGHVY